MRVLIVEDDAPLRRAIGREITRAGHEVLHVDTLGRAVELARDAQVVLLDLHLPDADGMQAPRKLRACDPQLPIVVWTGRCEGQVQRELESFEPPILWEPKGGGLDVARLLRKLRVVVLHREMGATIDSLDAQINALTRSGVM